MFADVREVFTERAKRRPLDGVRREFGLADAGACDQTPPVDKSVSSCTAVRGAATSTVNSAEWSG